MAVYCDDCQQEPCELERVKSDRLEQCSAQAVVQELRMKYGATWARREGAIRKMRFGRSSIKISQGRRRRVHGAQGRLNANRFCLSFRLYQISVAQANVI